MIGREGVERSFFDTAYDQAPPPWETGKPQPVFVRLAKSGAIKGEVLDVGCGTGENALYLAQHGGGVLGIDMVRAAIEQATRKAKERKVKNVQFRVADALKLARLKRTFDTVIDSGLFHVFSDEDRATYVKGLRSVMRPGASLFILCFSDKERSKVGPRRIHRSEIEATFGDGWIIHQLRPARFQSRVHRGGAKAWLVWLVRTGHDGLPGMHDQVAAASQLADLTAMAVTLLPAAAGATIQHEAIPDPASIAADQHCENWCWAASLEMLCRSQDVVVQQETFVKKIYGPGLPCWPSGTFETIKQALAGDYTTEEGKKVRLAGAYHLGVPTDVRGIIRSIRDGRPFIFGFAGHAHVCYGVWWAQQGSAIQILQFDLIDPLWKLFPNRPEFTQFIVGQDPLWRIDGTFELLVKHL